MLDNLCVLQYKGGRCVEFFAGYLSTHPEFKPYLTVWHSDSNTYNVQDPLREYLRHLYNTDLEIIKKHLDSELKTITSTYYSASTDQLLEKVSLFKSLLIDQSARVVLSHSKTHNLFFDCMLMIKHWFKVMPSGKKRWAEEFSNCKNIDEFLSETGLAVTGENKFNKSLLNLGLVKQLDIDSIFFNRDYSTWLETLEYFEVKPRPDYQTVFEEYHARNIVLAEQFNVPLDRDTDDRWFRDWVVKHA